MKHSLQCWHDGINLARAEKAVYYIIYEAFMALFASLKKQHDNKRKIVDPRQLLWSLFVVEEPVIS